MYGFWFGYFSSDIWFFVSCFVVFGIFFCLLRLFIGSDCHYVCCLVFGIGCVSFLVSLAFGWVLFFFWDMFGFIVFLCLFVVLGWFWLFWMLSLGYRWFLDGLLGFPVCVWGVVRESIGVIFGVFLIFGCKRPFCEQAVHSLD